MISHSGEYNFDDILHFPEHIELLPYGDVFVALAVDNANWVVLQNAIQKEIFVELQSGLSVGAVVEKYGAGHLFDVQSVLVGICARGLALPSASPTRSFYDASQHLNIYLTNACNLNCVHCFMKAGSQLAKELCEEDWLAVISQFKALGGTNVTFTGGEPLMKEGFEDIVKYTHEQGLQVTILSNGLLWSPTMIDRLSPYIDEVQFSIDGVDEDSNAKVRGAHHFDKVIQTVILFAKHQVRTSVATTFTLENISTAEQYKRFVERIKEEVGDAVFFKLTKKLLPGRGVNYSEQEAKRYYETVRDIDQAVNPGGEYVNFMEGHDPNTATRNCGYGSMSIAANGNVYYCNRILELQSYGNVKRQSLKELKRIGKELLEQTSIDAVEPCKTCKLRYVCGGDCRIDDFNFKGRLQGWNKEIRQVSCNEDFRKRLLKRMVESYIYYYHVHG